MAETVIGGALLRVLQAIVGDADRLELRLALSAARIAVRVMLHGELAIGRLDGLVVRSALDPEQFVEIDFNMTWW